MDWTAGYVDVGYTHDFYRELSPALQQFALLSRGIGADIETDRPTYCELGCGHGFSTVLLAAAHPQGRFYANDFLPNHIAFARKLANDTGTTNVHFYEDSFEEFKDCDLPQFDIIALHGVYSWVSAENRRHIIDFIARKLKVGGSVYISYNCQPGWASAAPLRELMIMFSGDQAEPLLPRIEQAFNKIQTLFDTNSMYARANPLMKDRFEGIRKMSRSYVAHEYFNRDWTIFYHTDVARDLREAKLGYAASTQLIDHLENFNFTPDQQKVLNDTPNADHREVLRDFLTNRQFRRDIYVKGGLTIDRRLRDAQIATMRFVLSVLPDEVPRSLLTPLGSLGLNAAVFDPMLEAFNTGPRTMAQLMELPALQQVGLPVILESVSVLVGSNLLQPCLEAAGDATRAKSTARFNTALMQRARHSGELTFLASPLTGGGYAIGRFEQLFLLAHQNRHASPPGFVWECLQARGEGLLREGQLLRTAEENLAHLTESHERFMKHMPVLKRLGIA